MLSKNSKTMKKIVAALLLLLLAGCAQAPKEIQEQNQTNSSSVQLPAQVQKNSSTRQTELNATQFLILLDKNEYQEHDHLFISVSFNSNKEANGTLEFEGLENKWGRKLLNTERQMEIQKGENQHVLSMTLPSCSTCSGMLEGAYQVDVKLIVGGKEKANESAQFTFQKRS